MCGLSALHSPYSQPCDIHERVPTIQNKGCGVVEVRFFFAWPARCSGKPPWECQLVENSAEDVDGERRSAGGQSSGSWWRRKRPNTDYSRHSLRYWLLSFSTSSPKVPETLCTWVPSLQTERLGTGNGGARSPALASATPQPSPFSTTFVCTLGASGNDRRGQLIVRHSAV